MKPVYLRQKLFFYYSCVILVILVGAVIGFLAYSYHSFVLQEQDNLSRLSQKTISEVDNLFSDMDKIALYVSTNPGISAAFQQADSMYTPGIFLETQAQGILTAIGVPNSSSRFRVSLYNRHGNFITTGLPTVTSVVNGRLGDAGFPQWYAELPTVSNSRSLVQHEDYWSQGYAEMVSLFREIYSPITRKPTAVVEVQAAYKTLAGILSFSGSDTAAYLYSANGEQLFYPNADEAPLAGSFAEVLARGGEEADSFGTRDGLIYYVQRSPFSGWALVLTASAERATALVRPLLVTVIFLGLFMAAASLCTVYYISVRVTRPLRQLNDLIQKVSLSNLSLQIPSSPRDDEFVQVNQAFKQMFACLQDSMDEVVKMKAHEIKAHAVALQSQMDPHFLYNMIAVIKAMSREDNARAIGQVCDYLADALRYISSYDDAHVPLKKELDNAERYLGLMKFRYEGKLEYKMELDPSIFFAEISLPKLCLQPLVENCFQHGFSQTLPPWQVTIKAWAEDEHWYVSVVDNGEGIPPENIRALLERVDEFMEDPAEKLITLKMGGMGLVNTLVRLRLRYKQESYFFAGQLENGCTCITIGGACDDISAFS